MISITILACLMSFRLPTSISKYLILIFTVAETNLLLSSRLSKHFRDLFSHERVVLAIIFFLVGTHEVTVFRNDKFKIEDLEEFDKILLSPGPGIPEEAGLLKEVIAHYKTSKSIMGVCLGHQAIAEVFGGQLINLTEVYHGIASSISVKEKEGIFQGLEDRIQVGRYHSWVVDPGSIPE